VKDSKEGRLSVSRMDSVGKTTEKKELEIEKLVYKSWPDSSV
jgi:hypothetical protein